MLDEKKKKQRVANLQLVKMSNLTLIFNLINKKRSVSRAELAQVTGLSPTTVSSLVDELIENSMVRESGIGSLNGSGRKPILLEINPEGGYVLTAELCQEGFVLALFDLEGAPKSEKLYKVKDFSKLGAEIVRSAESVLREHGIPEKKLLGVCVGVPGIIDKASKRITSTVLPVTEDNDFFDVLHDRFHSIPVKMGNESCFCAYSEKVTREINVHSLVYIDFNVGIGAGIILDDRIFTGAFGNAGEFGHISVDYNGPVCKCGNRGCIEAVASMPAILKRVSEKKKAVLTIDELVRAFNNGDETVGDVVRDACRALATGINSAINMVNPEAIIIGGDITKLGSRFLELLRLELDKIMFKTNSEKLIIDYSTVGVNPVTHGAAYYMLDTIFKANGFIVE